MSFGAQALATVETVAFCLPSNYPQKACFRIS